MREKEISPEDSAALDDLTKKRNITALIMRVVNGTAPVRRAAKEAIHRLLEEDQKNI